MDLLLLGSLYSLCHTSQPVDIYTPSNKATTTMMSNRKQNYYLVPLVLSSFASNDASAMEKSPSSFRQVAADAATFLRKKKEETPRARDVTSAGAKDLPYFGGEEGEKCRIAAIEEWENDDASMAKRQTLLTIMESDLYRAAADRCGAEIELYDRASGLVCLLEKENTYNTTYGAFWGGDNYYSYLYYDGHYDLATMFE